MDVTKAEFDILARRVAELERHNRRLHRVVVLLACGGLGWLVAGPRLEAQDPGKAARPRSVAAEQFLVVDAAGGTRAELGMAKDGPLLRLLDGAGRSRAELAVGKDGPFSVLQDEHGRPRISLGLRPEGSVLRLDDANGHLRMAFGLRPEGSFIRLDDEGQRPRVGLTTGRGDASVTVFGRDGAVVLSRRF